MTAPIHSELAALAEMLGAVFYAYDVDADGSVTLAWSAGALACLPEPLPAEGSDGGIWRNLVHSEDRGIVVARAARLRTGEPSVDDIRVAGAGGAANWLRLYGKPAERDGRVVRILGAVQEITEYVERDEQNEHLASIVEEQDAPIISKTVDGIVLSWNKGAQRVYGYTPAEMIGESILKIVPKGFLRDEVLSIQKRVSRGERVARYEAQRITKDGRPLEMSITFSPVFDKLGNVVGISTVQRDITERKRHEQTIRDSEGRMRAILDNTVDGIVTIDEKGTVESFNRAAEKIFGYPAYEVVGKNVKMLIPDPYHNGHDDYIANYRETGKAKIIGIGREIEGRHKSGRIIPIDLAVSEVQLGTRRIFTGITRDITERKRHEAEREHILRELIRSNEELEVFADTVSHDLREPLRKTRMFADRLLGSLGDQLDIREREYLERIPALTRRMQRLVDDLLTYALLGGVDAVWQPVELTRIVGQVVGELEPSIREIGGTVDVDPLPTIEADETQMAQLFHNLLHNTIKFRRPDTPLRVHISAEDLADTGEIPWTLIAVDDNGSGIERDETERIFGIFERSKGSKSADADGDTGIGLAICRRIVTRLGGTIVAEALTPYGTRFEIRVPHQRLIQAEYPTPAFSVFGNPRRPQSPAPSTSQENRSNGNDRI